MPRPLRIHLPDAFYHATLRGNHRQDIFQAASERVLLERIVARALKTYDARLHAYCWMTNHLHFLVRVGADPLGSVMRQIASEYARAFQKNLGTTGHLFERRYHARLVLNDSYLLTALRYIHQNPLEARLVQSLDAYAWSSHRAYAGGQCPDWLETDFILRLFASERRTAIAAYRRFIAIAPAETEPVGIAAPVAAAKPFATPRRPLTTATRSAASLDALVAEACRRFGTTIEQLYSDCRDAFLVKVRAWIAHQALVRRIANLSQIARALRRDRATLRSAMRRHPQPPD